MVLQSLLFKIWLPISMRLLEKLMLVSDMPMLLRVEGSNQHPAGAGT